MVPGSLNGGVNTAGVSDTKHICQTGILSMVHLLRTLTLFESSFMV